jgi:hypothetical protein
MMKFTILVRGTKSFVVEVGDDMGTLISSQTFLTEADADDWIIEQGQGTEYTVARVMDYMVGRW